MSGDARRRKATIPGTLTVMVALLTKSKSRDKASSPAREADGAKPLVLVVEDHEDTRFLLNCLLGLYGCRVVEADDGEDAVRLAVDARPDLILMDISLPRLDGFAATRRLRQTHELQDVPIIFLSGHAEASFRAEALARGGDDYLVKPFAPDEIKRIVERHLGERASKEQLSKRDLL